LLVCGNLRRLAGCDVKQPRSFVGTSGSDLGSILHEIMIVSMFDQYWLLQKDVRAHYL
jgi:hypothetical protein